MAVSYDYYKVFYVTAQLGSITRAAAKLHLTQPTVSHTIRLLEQELSCRLFVRSQKGVTLTPEAQALFLHVQSAFEHFEKAEAELSSARSLQSGQLRIGASETTLRHCLFGCLTAFRQKHPAVRCRIYNTTTPAALEDLSRGLLDFAVLVTPDRYQNDRFISRPLGRVQDVFLAGNGFPRLKGRLVSLSELARHPIISMTEGTLTRDCLSQLFLEHQLTLQPSIEFSTADLITPMVRENMGIGFVPRLFAEPDIQQGKIFQIAVKEPIPSRQVRLFYPAEQPLSPAARAFVETL